MIIFLNKQCNIKFDSDYLIWHQYILFYKKNTNHKKIHKHNNNIILMQFFIDVKCLDIYATTIILFTFTF